MKYSDTITPNTSEAPHFDRMVHLAYDNPIEVSPFCCHLGTQTRAGCECSRSKSRKGAGTDYPGTQGTGL